MRKKSFHGSGDVMMDDPAAARRRRRLRKSLAPFLDQMRETYNPGPDDQGLPVFPVLVADDHRSADPYNPDQEPWSSPGTSIVKVDGAAGPPAPRRRSKRKTEPDRVPKTPELDALAQTIRERHKKVCAAYRKACAAYRTAVDDALEAGRALIEAKVKLGHGPFGAWVERSCGFSERTAQVYMQVAKGVAGGQFDLEAAKAQSSAGLSINSILKKLARPRRKRAETVTAQVPSTVEPADPESSCEPADRQRHEQRHQQADSHDGDKPLTCELVEAATEPAQVQPADSPTIPDGRETERTPNVDGTMGPDDATPAAEPGGATVATSDTTDVIDVDEWLASMEIRAQLSDPSEFDENALLWLHLQPVRSLMAQIYTPSHDDLNLALNPLRYRERVPHLVAALLGMNPPDRWLVCPRCQGKRWCVAPGIECVPCGGTGFIITHAGDSAVSANYEPDVIVDGDGE
jgi:hypothetical protein